MENISELMNNKVKCKYYVYYFHLPFKGPISLKDVDSLGKTITNYQMRGIYVPNNDLNELISLSDNLTDMIEYDENGNKSFRKNIQYIYPECGFEEQTNNLFRDAYRNLRDPEMKGAIILEIPESMNPFTELKNPISKMHYRLEPEFIKGIIINRFPKIFTRSNNTIYNFDDFYIELPKLIQTILDEYKNTKGLVSDKERVLRYKKKLINLNNKLHFLAQECKISDDNKRLIKAKELLKGLPKFELSHDIDESKQEIDSYINKR